jgi:hypothetical protein
VPAQPPGDWRQEWGKMDTAKAPPKIEPVRADVPRPPAPLPTQVVQAEAPKPLMPSKPVLPSADLKRPDPLKDAEPVARRPLEDRVAPKVDAPRPPSPYASASNPPPVVDASRAPSGTQSVLQSGSPQYVPVPIVTIPDYQRSPRPPDAQVPQAPQLNLSVNGNAFVNPPPEQPVNTTGEAVNAFTPVPEVPPPGSYPVNAFREGYSVPTYQGPPPGMYAAMNRPGYPAMQGQPMLPPSYPGAMARPMMPATPYGPYPSANPAMYQGQPYGPMGPGYQPAGYPMPAQPGMPPMGQPIARMGYQVATAAPSAEAQWQSASGAGPQQLVAMLRDSFLPSQREYAALRLAALDARTNPDAVQALVTAAREDPAATVRAGCVNALAQMKAATAPVVAAVEALKADGDPRVQFAAEQALATLAPERMTPKDLPVQQTFGSAPAEK